MKEKQRCIKDRVRRSNIYLIRGLERGDWENEESQYFKW